MITIIAARASAGPIRLSRIARQAAPISLADAPVTVTLLLDPHGVVHASAGILPTKAIAIPPDQFSHSLERLRTTFVAAPVLTPRDAVELPLPAEPGFAWSWLERQGDAWHETPHHPTVTLAEVVAGFGASGAELWPLLVETRRVRLGDDAERGMLVQGDVEALAAGLVATGLDARGLNVEAVERGLLAIAEAIGEAPTTARPGGRVVAREGWLQLRPLPAAASSGDGEAER